MIRSLRAYLYHICKLLLRRMGYKYPSQPNPFAGTAAGSSPIGLLQPEGLCRGGGLTELPYQSQSILSSDFHTVYFTWHSFVPATKKANNKISKCAKKQTQNPCFFFRPREGQPKFCASFSLNTPALLSAPVAPPAFIGHQLQLAPRLPARQLLTTDWASALCRLSNSL